MKQAKSFKAYMCSTDFFTEWQLNPSARAPEIYKTMAALKRDRTCWKECGIAEIKVSFVKMKTKNRFPE